MREEAIATSADILDTEGKGNGTPVGAGGGYQWSDSASEQERRLPLSRSSLHKSIAQERRSQKLFVTITSHLGYVLLPIMVADERSICVYLPAVQRGSVVTIKLVELCLGGGVGDIDKVKQPG